MVSAAARWVVLGQGVQHRDPGCRGLTKSCVRARNFDLAVGLKRDPLTAAIARGFVEEKVPEEVEHLRPCSYCYSKAGYRRLPHDLPYVHPPVAA